MAGHRIYRKLLSLAIITILGSIGITSLGRKVHGQLSLQPAVFRPDSKQPASSRFPCLPKDVQPNQLVAGATARKPGTLEKKLVSIGARCRKGKLVDAKGRGVRFFRISCWGNPPEDYQEIQRRESAELEKLKKRYTVIVFGCNPMIQ